MLVHANWSAVVERARAQRVGPLLYKALKHEPTVPPQVLQTLRDSYRGTAARVAQLRAVLVEVLRALEAAGIPVVLLKGAALSVDVFTDIGLRPWSDLDVLIDQRHSAGAEQALAALGFQRARVETTAGATVAHENELLLVDSAGHLVDLHWSLFDSPFYQSRTRATAIWRHTREVRLEGVPARVLTPEVLLLHLCGHLTLHHSGDELLWLNDVAEVVARHHQQLNWEVVLAEAQRLHLVVALQRALGSAAETLAAPVPPAVRNRIKALHPSATELAVVGRLADKERSMAARLWFDLATMESWTERVAFVRTRLFPSPAYMRQRYGVTTTLGLVLAYPYRWLIGLRRGSLG